MRWSGRSAARWWAGTPSGPRSTGCWTGWPATGAAACCWSPARPGIGKSRLLAEAAAHARDRGLLVLTGRPVPGSGSYRAVAEALVGHLGDRRPDDAPELRPYRAALARLLPGRAGGSDPEVETADSPLLDLDGQP